MVLKLLYLFREGKYIFLTFMSFTVIYFLAMDVVTYQVLQNTTLVKENTMVVPKIHSPFHPLTVKLLTLDHYSHYFIKPTAELFNYVTDFSNIFFFVTPNMISAAHVLVGLVVGKCVSSECLRQRRMGALLYEFRTWLDGLDGVVYRSRLGETLYTTHGESVVNIDNVCDVIGGIALSIGVYIYLLKYFHKLDFSSLPLRTKNGKVETDTGTPAPPSKRVLFIIVALYGALVAIAGRTWEMQVSRAESLFEKPLPTPEATSVQTVLLHSCSTWWMFWCWRLIGQMFFHYLVIAILLDKIWEFISCAWYIGGFIVIALNAVSYCHLNHVQALINV